ncbi:TPA: DUF859 family phage minor structural protein, partial [Streptococcus agalactiae]|nr:hypothetical protein [Streptococcus agalactiae]
IIDAKGDVYVDGTIYCGDKAIQQKPLALNNGGSFRHDDTDLNSLQDTGFYCVFRGANRPAGAGPGYVTVVRHETANYAYQQFYDRTNKTIFTRLLENGVWSGWSEYVKKDSLQTTGWITIGNGFKYKRKGDDIDLMYNFASNGLQRWSVGNMPSGLIPQELMFAITGWTLAPDKSIHLQINASGLIECINPGAYSNTYRGVVHWSI